MVSSRLRRAAGLAATLTTLGLVVCIWQKTPVDETHSPTPLGTSSTAGNGSTPDGTDSVVPAATKESVEPIAGTAGTSFEAFDRWTSAYRNGSAEERAKLLDEGVALASKRRAALKELIVAVPREALNRAVPVAVRQNLPPEVQALLEERVNSRGFFGVKGTYGGESAPIRREVRLADESRYDAYVFGRRSRQGTTEDAFLNGIAVDRTLALDERPLRVLEAGERPDGRKPIVETCPISGKTTAVAVVDGTLPQITEDTPAVELGGSVHYLCSGGHILAVEDDAIAREGSTGGSGRPTGGIPATWNTGPKTHLYIRVTFPDQNTDPQNEASCYDMMKSVNDFMLENSFGKCYFLTTVTPLLILPRTEAWYIQEDDDGAVLADARVAAKAAGYDPAQFDFDTVRYNGGPGSFGGQAFVHGKGCWLKSSSVGTACHEYGHNLGLWHANYWNTTPASVIGPGANSEYGNSFDTMGAANAGNNHFGAYNKNVINWLTDELITTVTASGTYRVFTIDQLIADPARRYALKIKKDTQRNYWAEFRQKFTSNIWMMSGLQLTWDAWGDDAATGSNGGPQLLDTTPGSPDGKNDAQLVIGRTFSDFESGIHITPIGKGSTTPESMDVVVNLGSFPGNRAPTLSLSASATSVATNATVTFTAAANDPDADPLAFAWDFGDRTFSPRNSAVVSKSWGTAGLYTVRCTASDMKGKVTTSYVVVTVGSPGTFSISGRITAGGTPVEGVLVSNGQTGTAFRGTYSDSAGNYTVSNVAGGSTTLTAQLYGYNLAPVFTNPVAVGPNATGKDFTATTASELSITAIDPIANEGGDPGVFRITRSGSTSSALTVRLFSPSGTATRTTDYTLSPDPVSNLGVYEVVMPAGAATLNITVNPVVTDTTAEGPETVILQLVPLAGYAISGPQSAIVTLDDNDTTLPRVSIAMPDEYGNESGDNAQLVFTRTGATATPLTIQFTRSGTATNGTDYANIGTSTVIPAGAASVALPIVPIDDTIVEGNETVTVTIASNAAYVRDSTAQAVTVTINDNDVNVLTVAATDNTASETGDIGTFTITRRGDLTNALTVDYVLGGTALHGTDYQKLSGAATILAGEAVTTVTIVPIDDAIGEPQQTIILQLRSGTSSELGAPASATVNLNDNDLPTISVTEYDAVAIEPASGSGTDTARFRIYRSGGTGAFTANYTITGTATSGTDFTAVASSVAFAAADATKDITITALADANTENTETVTLTLTPNAAYTVEPESVATVQIIDDDQVAVSVSTEDVTVSETSTQMRFWVSRSGSTTAALSVNIQMTGTATEGVDYTGSTGPVTIPAAEEGVYIALPIVNDTTAEGTETVTMNVVPVPGSYGTRVASATYNLGDNDTAGLPQVRFNVSSSSGPESVSTVNVPVSLSAAASTPVTVAYAINGGSATGYDVDYTLANGVLQFDPGVTSLSIPLTIIDDIFPEPAETIAVALSNANGATLGTSTHTYSITDNDAAPSTVVAFAGTSSSALESVASPSSFVVSLSAPAAAPVTVDYEVTGGTATSPADYTLNSGTLTFPVGAVALDLPISIVEDGLVEANETVVVTLSNATGATLGANTVHTFTITDNDAATVTVVASDNSATESGDPGAFIYTRSGATTSALVVNVTIGGSATNGADYQLLTTTVNFSSGQTSVTVPVIPYLDGLTEGDETVTVSLTAGASYTLGAAGTATVTIVESGTLVAISATDAIASETDPDTGVFTITRSGNTTDPLSVDLTLSGTALLGSDYTAPVSPVVIAAGASTATVVITPIDDAAAESAETVTATISASADYTIAAPGSATLTLIDNDSNTAPVLARISPTGPITGVPAGIGLLLEAAVSDDGKPANPGSVSLQWTRQSGPGSVIFGSANQASTTARFSTNGTYLLRLTATDGALASTLDVTVSVGGAPAFTGQNIVATPAGSFTLLNGTYTVRGGGTNISGTTDQFYFLHQPLIGDGEIRARVVNITGGQSSAKAGVMFRNDLTGPSRMAYMSSYGPASTTNANSFRTRATDGAAVVNTGNGGAPTYPLWVRVVRSGDSFSGFTSTNGQTWTQVGPATQITTNAQLFAGLAVTSNDTANLCTATFDSVSLSSWPSNLGVAVNAGQDVSVTLPDAASLTGSASDDAKPQPPGAFTLSWSKVSGPGTVTFANPAAASTTADVSDPGTYVLRLVADDGEVKTYDDVTLTTSQPIVTVQASDPSASEFGPGTGTFTFTRSGATTDPLTVQFSVDGTATSEDDYVPLPQTIVIDAGQSTATLTLTPVADTEAEGSESVQVSIVADSDYGIGTPGSATVTVNDLPIDAWRLDMFGTDANTPLISGDLVDTDGDGSSNLLEWAQGTSPISPGATQTQVGLEPGFVTLTYRRALAATDVTFTVIETQDFTSWTAANVTEEIVSDDGVIRVIKARVPIGTSGNKLLRLRITR